MDNNNDTSRRAIDLLHETPPIEIPFNVWRMFRDTAAETRVHGNEISFGTDYGSLQEMRDAIKWYAAQLGGTITWE